MRAKRQTVSTTRRSQIGQQRSVSGGWEEKFDMSDVKVEGGEAGGHFVEVEDREGEEEAEVEEEEEEEEVETDFKEETKSQWRSESSLGDCEAKLSEMVGRHFLARDLYQFITV